VNILIVDDVAMNRLVLKRLLSRFDGLNVYEAEDGEIGWEKLPLFAPGLIFCDIFMPKVDGLSFVMRLREHPVYFDTPVIITSAGKDREVVLKLKELGITDYLLKPYELKSTFERLEAHLRPLMNAATKGPMQALGSTGAIPVPEPEPEPAEAGEAGEAGTPAEPGAPTEPVAEQAEASPQAAS
jgi:CheY-like chemotaxis protein